MQFTRAIFVFSVTGLLLLTSCTRNFKYNPSPVQTLYNVKASCKIDNITVRARKWEDDDYLFYFGYFPNAFKVIQLSITNNAKCELILSQDNLNINALSTEYVIRKTRSTLFKSAAFLLIPVPPIALLAAIFHGLESNKANLIIENDIRKKAFNQEVIIPINQTINTLLFISPTRNVPRLQLSLTDLQNENTINFQLNL